MSALFGLSDHGRSHSIAEGGPPANASAQPLESTRRARPAQRNLPLRKSSKRRPAPIAWDDDTLGVFFLDARKLLPAGIPAPPSLSSAGDSASADHSATRQSAEPSLLEWSRWVSPEALEDEIKTLVLQLSEEVRSSRKFNGGGFRTVAGQLGLLAALFGTIAEHDGKVRWRDAAAALRDRFAAAAAACTTAGDESLQQAKLAATDLADLVRGGRLDLPEAKARPAWAELAERHWLMSRMETAEQERLRPWTADQDAFERDAERLAHEAQILALISRIISDESFDYSDEEEYRQAAELLQQASTRLVRATQERELAVAQSAVRAITKSCNGCHENYR